MMQNIVTILLLALLTLTPGCISQSPMASTDDMISSAKSVDASFVTAFNKGDGEAVAALYWNSPDLVVYPPDTMELHGWQAAHDSFVGMTRQMPGAQMELVDSNYRAAGEYVINNGLWNLKLSNGQILHGRYTAVLANKDGKWVFVLDHPSVPLLPPTKETTK